jgi:hypothetical protein
MWSSTPGWPRPAAPTRTAPAESMIRGLSACVLALLSVAAPAAEEAEQLDAEFLEYLAHLEGDDDDWTLVAEAEEAQSPPHKEAQTKTPKPSKQADEPAVDER